MSSLKMCETYLDLSEAMTGALLGESALDMEVVKLRVCCSGRGRSRKTMGDKTARKGWKSRMGYMVQVLDRNLFMRYACGRSKAIRIGEP